jgi:HEAT repeat protein
MFDQELWRKRIAEKMSVFARNPRQEIQITGVSTVLAYLAIRTIEPFLDAFQTEPVASVVTLAEITRGPGADQIVRRATQFRYQMHQIAERELRNSAEVRFAIEQLLIGLDVIHLARQRLNSSRDDWLRQALLNEIGAYQAHEFSQLRRLLQDPDWQSRYDAIRNLRQRNGRYTASDLVLLHDGLSDSASHVRAAAARILGQFAESPPQPLIDTLTRVALYDCDLETRYAAARALGSLRDRIASPQLIDHLAECLLNDDGFVRSAAALILSQLGDVASTPNIVERLTRLLQDQDPYAREAAARALGRLGPSAAISEVLSALTEAMQDSDANVHEAALDALTRLRKLRTSMPLSQPPHPSELTV